MAGYPGASIERKRRDGMTSKSLKWARKQGLNCEMDIMSQQLRMQCRGLIQGWIVIAILVLSFFFFAGKVSP